MTTTANTIDNKARQIISNIRNLPTPPIVFNQIQKVLNDENVSAAQVASILAEDPAMSIKVLKLTNSAFYGLSREIETVKHAVVIVGLEAIKNLVLAASVLDMFKGKNLDQEYQDAFWRHSLAVASCSKLLARQVKTRGMVDPDAAFSAGLLHDIGKMIIASFLTEEFAKFLEKRATDTESPDYAIEQEVLGYTHTDIGTLLSEQWQLPARMTEAISFHHQPQSSDSTDPISFLVHIADVIARKVYSNDTGKSRGGPLLPGVLEHMQISEEQIEEFGQMLEAEYAKAETFMQIAGIS